MDITKDTLYSYLLFDSPIRYTEDLILYPLTMDKILEFTAYKSSITVRKNTIFPVKKIIKMSYLDFLFYCFDNEELAEEYDMPNLPLYYSFALQLLKLVFKDQEVLANATRGGFKINGVEITADQFDDIRRIIIIQNGVDFDIDEFIHYDTEKKLNEAKDFTADKEDNASIEDYIDSICIAMNMSDEQVKNLSIRKFWRYVKRISKRDTFTAMKPMESIGMVKFKEPIRYWMTTIDDGDKYKDVKTDSQEIERSISG